MSTTKTTPKRRHIPNIVERLIAAQKSVGKLEKDVSVGGHGGGYKGTSHDHVAGLCRGALTELGVLAMTSVVNVENRESTFRNGNIAYVSDIVVETTFYNADDPADRLIVRSAGTGIDSGDKAIGKAMSYAKKYGLIMGLMMSSFENEEQRPEDALGSPLPPAEPNPATDTGSTRSRKERDLRAVQTLIDSLPDGDIRTKWLDWLKTDRTPHTLAAAIDKIKAQLEAAKTE